MAFIFDTAHGDVVEVGIVLPTYTMPASFEIAGNTRTVVVSANAFMRLSHPNAIAGPRQRRYFLFVWLYEKMLKQSFLEKIALSSPLPQGALIRLKAPLSISRLRHS